MSGYTVKSGKRKMKGGWGLPTKDQWLVIAGVSWVISLLVALTTMGNDELVHGNHKPIYFVHVVFTVPAVLLSVFWIVFGIYNVKPDP